MRHSGTWSHGVYSIHLGSYSAEELECDAAAIFVRELNARNNTALRFKCRPDKSEPIKGEQTRKAPDFLYVDDDTGVRLAVEIKQPFRQEYKFRDDLLRTFAKDIEACLKQPVRCLIVCDDDGVASWMPPKHEGKEKQQHDQMCEKIARRLECEAARMGRGVLQIQAETASSAWIDLTSIMPADALLLTYGEERRVGMVAGGGNQRTTADGPAAGPSSSAVGNGPDGTEGDAAWRQRMAEYWGDRWEGIVAGQQRDTVMQEIMRKTYQRLLADANAQFGSYGAPKYETVFLLDGRIQNHIFPYDPETLSRFHRDAVDGRPNAPDIKTSDFSCIQHVVVLGVGGYGVQATAVWRADDARLIMPGPEPFLPEGWSLNP